MSSSINTPQLRKLWREAQRKPEWATTKFWEYVFKQNVFSSRRWSVASQQPPTQNDDDLRRVDLVVENIDDNENSTTLLFMEAKRVNVTLDLIDEVEYQAFTACCAHLYDTGRPAIWAMTCIGSMTRLWAYHYNSDYLTPFWPVGRTLSERGEYAEYSTHGQEILQYLDYMKRNPIPDEDFFSSRSPSPRPASPQLPQGWHDAEVAMVAVPSQAYTTASSTTSVQQQLSGQVQPGEYEVPVVDANDAYEVIVDNYNNNIYTCHRVIDGADMYVPDHEWVQCSVRISGSFRSGHFITDSGYQHYTMSLEPQGRAGRRR